jgi:hypothetical protein
MINKFLTLFLVLFTFNTAFSQNNYSISGVIKDKEGTLPGAAIYLSGYKIATTTNNEGKFILPNLAAGNYDILVQMIGYLPYAKNITISDKSMFIDVVLSENVTMLNEVVIKPDPYRLAHINLFKSYFIGQTPNAAQCKILNTDALIIDDDKKNTLLKIKSNDFLVIENNALGYRLKYLLEYFEYNYSTKIIYYAGYPYYEELKGGSAKQKRWQKNRITAYNGSIQHFLKSLYHNTSVNDGFVINKIASIPNQNRKPDSLISANIKKLTTGQMGANRMLTFKADDSLNYWLKQRKEPKELNVISRRDVLVDTLVKIYNNDLKSMNYADALYIIYTKEKETETYRNSGYYLNRPADLSNHQVSIIELIEAPAYFYANGGVLNTKSLLYKGFWGYEKIADMVPLDFIVNQKR